MRLVHILIALSLLQLIAAEHYKRFSDTKFQTMSHSAQADHTMLLNPSRDSVKDKYPIGFGHKILCYDVPSSDVITLSQISTNSYGWPLTAPPNCGGSTRQVVFEDRYPVDSSQVNEDTPIATYWGRTVKQIEDMKLTKSYSGLAPALVTGHKLKVALFSPGSNNFGTQYSPILSKIPATHGWLVSNVEISLGDLIWQWYQAPHNWRQQGLYFKYRVEDMKRNILRLIEANTNPSHPYYQKLDLSVVYLFGHSDGGAAALNAKIGNTLAALAVEAINIPGVRIELLPSMDASLWVYPGAVLSALANDSRVPFLWSQNQVFSQTFWRLWYANNNQDQNNHLLIEHIVHDMFQLASCNIAPYANMSSIRYWWYPGVSAETYCVKAPYDTYMGPLLPKPRLQDVANIIFEWFDRSLTAIEADSKLVYKTLYSTYIIGIWQSTLPIDTIHYGRWHCGNYSATDEPSFAIQLARGETGAYYSADYLDSLVSQIWYNDGPDGVTVWAYSHPEWNDPQNLAVTIVQPRYVEDLVADSTCSCASDLLC